MVDSNFEYVDTIGVEKVDVPSEKEIDSLLVRDMNLLTFKDRDQVNQEIHGVMDLIDEELSMVNQRLEQLEMELSLLSDEDLSAYRLAHSINPSYTTDPKFRLQFLRADRFRAKIAAKRLARYFREKLILFGPEKVGKERITLDDLSEEDKGALSTGFMQWLASKDRSGRMIHFSAVPLWDWRKKENQLRAFWYFLSAALDDEEVQKRGIVVIHFLMASYPSSVRTDEIGDKNVVHGMGVIVSTVPVRVEGMHVCCDQLAALIATKILLYVAGEALRVRIKYHLGSSIEVLYAIAPFGIPVEMFPVTDDAKFDMGPHKYWLGMRREFDDQYNKSIGQAKIATTTSHSVVKKSGSSIDTEDDSNSSQQGTSDMMVEPRPRDVLLGKLKATHGQIGNALFRRLVEDYRDDYERATSKLEKIQISKKIISQIKAGGARFLKQTNCKYGKNGRIINRDEIGWTEVTDQVARERISHAFRNLRARIAALKNATPVAPTSSGLRLTPFAAVPSSTIATRMNVHFTGSDSEGECTGCVWGNSSKARPSSSSCGWGGGGVSRVSL